MNVLSICSGVGGIELGIDLATSGAARVVCYVERETYATAILATRMAEGVMVPAPIWSDLGTFDARPWRGIVDCVTSGIPCQPYSAAGKQRGHDDERALWPELVRIVDECRPAMVFIENVPTFAGWFREPGEALCGLGYEVSDALFLAAEDLGAPHRRERVFIMAHAKGERFREAWGCSKRETFRPLCSSPMANAISGGHGRREDGPERGPERRNAPQRSGEQMADTERARWDVARIGRDEHAGGESETGCGIVADTEDANRRTGSSDRSGGAREWGRGFGGESVDVPDATFRPARNARRWPPAPGDRNGWAEVLAERPDLEPAVRRMADGIPHRMDRLRALGNGVVPIVAAVAFRELLRRIET